MSSDVPSDLIEIAKSFEGFHRVTKYTPEILASPYLCPAGFWTIGYGHLCPASHEEITLAQGERYLEEDLLSSVRDSVRLCPTLLLEPPRRLVAIADFTFNLGPGRLKNSTLRRRVNEGDWEGARQEIQKWVWGGGKKLPGLIKRRTVEAELLA